MKKCTFWRHGDTCNVKRDNLILMKQCEKKDTASAALVWEGLKVLMYSWGMVSPLPSSALITTVACTRSKECGPSAMRWWILTADEENQLLRVQVSEGGVHQNRDAV